MISHNHSLPDDAEGESLRGPTQVRVRKGSGGFVANVLALGAGSAVAQIVKVAAAPIICRMFAPDAFGIAAVYASIVAIIGTSGCFQYNLAIVLPKRDEDASHLIGLCLTAIAIVVVASALVLAFAGHVILPALKAGAILSYAWVIPVGILIMSLAIPLTSWYNRQKHFKRLAVVRVLGSGMGTLAVLVAGFWGWRTGRDLILARMIGPFLILGVLVFFWWKYDAGFVLRNCTKSGMWQQAKRYKKFPLISSWQGLVGNATIQAPTLLLAAFFGPTVAGLYALARRLLMLPGQLVSKAIAQVFYQRSAEAEAAGQDLSGLVTAVSMRLVGAGLLPLIVIALTGPDLFSVIFGQRWGQAGLYACILAPMLFVGFVFSPLSVLFLVLQRQGIDLISRVITAGLTIAALVFGGQVLRRPVLTLSIFSVVSSLGMLWRLGYLLKAVQVSRRALLRHFLVKLALAAPTALAYGLCKWVLDLPLAVCLLAAAVSAGPYVVVGIRGDRRFRSAGAAMVQKVRRRST